LNRKRDELVDNLFEVLDAVRFDEDSRILDLLAQSRLDAEASITDRGHVLAMQGAARSLSRGGLLDDLWEGPSGIRHIQAVGRATESGKSALHGLIRSFTGVKEKLLAAPARMLVVGEDGVNAEVMRHLGTLQPRSSSPTGFEMFALNEPQRQPNCAWVTNTQVNFCAKAFPAVTEGHADAPALAVLARYLSDGFLHPAIREKGGAYGAGAQYDVDSASFRFFSYRDPRLEETLADFDRSRAWLAGHEEPQRLEESILGVIRNLDHPRSPAGSAIYAFYDELDGRTPAVREAFREAVLAMTLGDVRRVAEQYLDPAQGTTGVVTHAGQRADVERLELVEIRL
jgi:Zn-dependent M16 (insulinase) family peptidase